MVQLPEARARVPIVEGVQFKLSGRTVTVKGPKGEVKRTFPPARVELLMENNDFVVRADLPRRAEKAAVGTIASHVQNMVHGVKNGYEYKLKTVFAHFPIKTQVKGTDLVVENFLGERSARKARILPGVKVDVKAEFITVSGADLEKVGQTAANIERSTKVRNRDNRVFQDGIFIIEKAA